MVLVYCSIIIYWWHTYFDGILNLPQANNVYVHKAFVLQILRTSSIFATPFRISMQ